MKKDQEPEVLTIKEAAVLSKRATGTIYNKINSGELRRHGTRKKALVEKDQVMELFNIPKKAG